MDIQSGFSRGAESIRSTEKHAGASAARVGSRWWRSPTGEADKLVVSVLKAWVLQHSQEPLVHNRGLEMLVLVSVKELAE